MKVAIYGQTYQDNAIEFLLELLEELKKENATVSIEAEFYELYRDFGGPSQYDTFTASSGLDGSFDMFVSFGGDGTILFGTKELIDQNPPILSFQRGTLGFMCRFKLE